MTHPEPVEVAPAEDRRRRLTALVLVTALYIAAAIAATWPMARHARTHLPPGYYDPAIHLWTMRWYRTCLLEGRSPFLSPELLHPLGTPLGYLPPMQLQTLGFLALSLVTSNDILNFNLLWFGALVATGLGVYSLARAMLTDRRAAVLSGLLAMLSGPMLFFGRNELEQVTLFAFPLFLLAWIRLLDAPTRGRLLAAVGGYALLAASGPYHAILTIVPAVVYVLHVSTRSGWRGAPAWIRTRVAWLAGFAALVALVVPVLFANQLWALANGFPVRRSDVEFEAFSASIWTYLFPWHAHQLMRQVMPDFSKVDGIAGRVPSYLGLVTLVLMVAAAVRRPRLRHAGYWWAAFGMLVVFSLGAYWTVGTHRIGLPAYWARKYGIVLQLIRVPARFNLLAAVCAAILAGAGYQTLASRIRRPGRRLVFGAVVAALAVADLAIVPYGAAKVPPLPAFYGKIRARYPQAVLLEAPYPNYRIEFLSTCALWQSEHRLRTSLGYTAVDFGRLANLTNMNSPFDAGRLTDPNFLADPDHEAFDLAQGVRFEDYAWLYLTRHGFDLVALHKRPVAYHAAPAGVERLKAVLASAKVYEDADVVVYDRVRMARPRGAVFVCMEGWRERVPLRGRAPRIVSREARLAVYNPDPARPHTLTLDASAYRSRRHVRLVAAGRDLACWEVRPGDPQSLTSPPFQLEEGMAELVLVSDGESGPAKPSYAAVKGDTTPFSLWVSAVRLEPAPTVVVAKPKAPGSTR